MTKLPVPPWEKLARTRLLPVWVEPYVKISVQRIVRARNPVYFAHLCRVFKAQALWYQAFDALCYHTSAEWCERENWLEAASAIDEIIERNVKELARGKINVARLDKLVERVKLLFALQVYIEIIAKYVGMYILPPCDLVFDPWPRFKIAENDRTDAYSYVSLRDQAYGAAYGLEHIERQKDFTVDWSWRICAFEAKCPFMQRDEHYAIRSICLIFMHDPETGRTYVLARETMRSGFKSLELAKEAVVQNPTRVGTLSWHALVRFMVLNGRTYWGVRCGPWFSVYAAFTGLDTIDVMLGVSTIGHVLASKVDASGLITIVGGGVAAKEEERAYNERALRRFYPWKREQGTLGTMILLQKAELDQDTSLLWYAPISDYPYFASKCGTEHSELHEPHAILPYLNYRTVVDGREYETRLIFVYQPPNANGQLYCSYACLHERTVAGLLARAT